MELGAAGSITSQWNVFANYTYTQAKTLNSSAYPDREGQRLGNTPRSSFSLWTTYKPDDSWTLGYGARFMGTRNVTAQGDGELASYLVHSAMVSYDLDKHFRLQLNVDNLGDKAYVERVRQVLGSESRSSAIEYGDGRVAMLTATYKF
ncbi:putative TonB-dependent receptor BfrD [compost metagenome]